MVCAILHTPTYKSNISRQRHVLCPRLLRILESAHIQSYLEGEGEPFQRSERWFFIDAQASASHNKKHYCAHMPCQSAQSHLRTCACLCLVRKYAWRTRHVCARHAPISAPLVNGMAHSSTVASGALLATNKRAFHCVVNIHQQNTTVPPPSTHRAGNARHTRRVKLSNITTTDTVSDCKRK